MYKGLAFIAILLGVFTALIFYNMNEENEAKKKELQGFSFHDAEREISFKAKDITLETTIAGIGDILIHDRVYHAAETSNGYNFSPMLQEVESLLQTPDLLIANQETILGGEEIGLSSYPSFNSPQQVGDALLEAGVDIVSTANNHSLDKNERGIHASLSYMDDIGLTHAGTYRSQEERDQLTVLKSNGISFAFLSYTYGTNGIAVPAGKEYLVNLIDRDQMKADIRKAKTQADVVILSIHWGNEYQRNPTEEQKELGKFLIDSGADVIFGHHPHVLQPMEWHTAEDGHTGLIVYSLGNFLSGQKNDYKDIGGLALIHLKLELKNGKKQLTLSDPQFFPTYVSSMQESLYHVVPLGEAGKYGLPHWNIVYEGIMEHMISSL